MRTAYRVNIEKETMNNTLYRKTLFATPQTQLVVMSIPIGCDIPQEKHKNITQFTRIESGKGIAVIGDKTFRLRKDIVIIIPQGVTHYIKNTGKEPLKLYSLYSPPEN